MPAASDAFVFFGASGDLAYKKIFPALQALTAEDMLDMPVIGMARSGWTVDQLRKRARDSIAQAGPVDEAVFARLSARMQYIDGDYAEPDTFARLKQALGDAQRPLHYLAIPPSLFGSVAQQLAAASCAGDARVVVEKPFGRDLASAQALNRDLHAVFAEDAIFRIDHYLGKEAVQNLLYFRFANLLIEQVWNRECIDSVQITMAESFGVEGRGAFYDEVGAIRDVVQNHLLQVLVLLAMDAPAGGGAQATHAEQLRLLRALRPLDPSQVARGQFQGYLDEAGVAKDSQVETFAAMRLEIDSPRWQGVPFYIRAGKCLPITATEVVVDLKRPALQVFDEVTAAQSNRFRFRLGPEVVIAADVRVKTPGEQMRGEATELVARHQVSRDRLPYERLLGDALRGDRTLFSSDEAVEAAWRVVDPALFEPTPVQPYAPGTWGPPSAAAIMSGQEGWHDPRPEASTPC